MRVRQLFHPLEQALVESYVKAALGVEKDSNLTLWGSLLRSWIPMMVGYLNANNDILGDCEDHRVVEWYSVHFGRVRDQVWALWTDASQNALAPERMPVDSSWLILSFTSLKPEFCTRSCRRQDSEVFKD
jgi:hypothetical protein